MVNYWFIWNFDGVVGWNMSFDPSRGSWRWLINIIDAKRKFKIMGIDSDGKKYEWNNSMKLLIQTILQFFLESICFPTKDKSHDRITDLNREFCFWIINSRKNKHLWIQMTNYACFITKSRGLTAIEVRRSSEMEWQSPLFCQKWLLQILGLMKLGNLLSRIRTLWYRKERGRLVNASTIVTDGICPLRLCRWKPVLDFTESSWIVLRWMNNAVKYVERVKSKAKYDALKMSGEISWQNWKFIVCEWINDIVCCYVRKLVEKLWKLYRALLNLSIHLRNKGGIFQFSIRKKGLTLFVTNWICITISIQVVINPISSSLNQKSLESSLSKNLPNWKFFELANQIKPNPLIIFIGIA